MAEFESSYKRYQHTLKKVRRGRERERERGEERSRWGFKLPFLPGEDWLVCASRPPRLPANRVEAFGAERCPTGSSGDEEGAGETRPGHEDEGKCSWMNAHLSAVKRRNTTQRSLFYSLGGKNTSFRIMWKHLIFRSDF